MNRKQELMLIEIGLQVVLNQYDAKPNGNTGRKWSDTQRKKFSKSMQKVWERKRREQTSPK